MNNAFTPRQKNQDLMVTAGCIICKLVLLGLALFLICSASGINYPWNVSF